MWIVQLALRRPYTFIVLALLILIIGPLADPRTPDRHLPQHQHPGGERHLALHRARRRGDGRAHHLAVRARDDARPSTTSSTSSRRPYNGVGVIKVFFHPSANIPTSLAQIMAIAQTMLGVLSARARSRR